MKYLKALIIFILVFVVFGAIGFTMNYINRISEAKGFFYLPYVSVIILVVFGLLLGFQTFNRNRKKEGKWKINYLRLFSLGLPALITGAFLYLYYFIPIRFFMDITFLLRPYLMNSMVIAMGQILFGYSIITSFYKKNV